MLTLCFVESVRMRMALGMCTKGVIDSVFSVFSVLSSTKSKSCVAKGEPLVLFVSFTYSAIFSWLYDSVVVLSKSFL